MCFLCLMKYVPPFEEERLCGSLIAGRGAPTQCWKKIETFKVKRIEVLPGKRLSYQKHSQRAEHWFVVEGTAKVTLDGNEITVRAGEAIDIPIGTAHRVENPGDDRSDVH